MEYKNFVRKKLINIYFQEKYLSKQGFYSIVETKRHYFFFKRWTVIFYERQDLINKISSLLFDLLENEFQIKIRKSHYDFANINNNEINLHLNTSNSNLLVGKFGQNQRSLQNYLSRTISFIFKKRYEILLHFTHNKNKNLHFNRFNKNKKFIENKNLESVKD